MTARVRERATYEQVLRLPENMVGEIVDGELYAWPRPRARHGHSALRIGGRLEAAFDSGEGGPGGWVILPEPELHLGGDVLVPDIGGWRLGRWTLDPDVARITVAPDWICEVMSPATASHDRRVKMPAYATHAVSHAWIVEPVLKTIEVYRLENARWSLLATYGEGDKMRGEPFEAIEIDLARIFASPLPPP
jgi:Uma2 family endonuclease